MTPKVEYAKVTEINSATYGKCSNHDERLFRNEKDIDGFGERMTADHKEIDEKLATVAISTDAKISKIYSKLDEAKTFAIAQLILLIIALIGFIGTILWESTKH
jgi:hypothetical protein